METYKEYPVRCKTCNEPLACFARDYETLLAARYSIEDSLNELKIMEYCSRIAMMNPTIVAFNMENREVIEGFKSVDTATEADAQHESTSHPVFNACIGSNIPIQPTKTLLITPGQPRIPATIYGMGLQPTTPALQPMQPPIQTTTPGLYPGIQGLQTLGLMQPIARLQTPVEALPPPIIPGIELGGIFEPAGEAIPIKGTPLEAVGKFETPTLVGVPTINQDSTVQQPLIYVGAGKQVRVLNGRTYLAR